MKNLLLILTLAAFYSCSKTSNEVPEFPVLMDRDSFETHFSIGMPVGYPFNTGYTKQISHTKWQFHEEYMKRGCCESIGQWSIGRDTFYPGHYNSTGKFIPNTEKYYTDKDTLIYQFDSHENVEHWGVVVMVRKYY